MCRVSGVISSTHGNTCTVKVVIARGLDVSASFRPSNRSLFFMARSGFFVVESIDCFHQPLCEQTVFPTEESAAWNHMRGQARQLLGATSSVVHTCRKNSVAMAILFAQEATLETLSVVVLAANLMKIACKLFLELWLIYAGNTRICLPFVP